PVCKQAAFIQNLHVDGNVAFAATSAHNHIHGRAERFIVLHACVLKRQPCGIGAEALPGFHLALVAALRHLQAPVHFAERVNRIGRKGFLIETRFSASLRESVPMHVYPFAERRKNADACDDDFIVLHELRSARAAETAPETESGRTFLPTLEYRHIMLWLRPSWLQPARRFLRRGS